jgi:hypothetical protein
LIGRFQRSPVGDAELAAGTGAAVSPGFTPVDDAELAAGTDASAGLAPAGRARLSSRPDLTELAAGTGPDFAALGSPSAGLPVELAEETGPDALLPVGPAAGTGPDAGAAIELAAGTGPDGALASPSPDPAGASTLPVG